MEIVGDFLKTTHFAKNMGLFCDTRRSEGQLAIASVDVMYSSPASVTGLSA
jgi:hypothetical protein